MKIGIYFLIFITAFIFSCGVKGNPYPPYSTKPKPIEDIKVKQQGDKFVVYFNYQKLYTDDNPIKEPIYFEIYKNKNKFNTEIKEYSGYYYFFDKDKEACYYIIVKTKRNKSNPSKEVCIKIDENIPEKPEISKIYNTEESVVIQIKGNEKEFNIYKVSDEEDYSPVYIAKTDKNIFEDKDVALNTKYCYYITSSKDNIESEKSQTKCIIFKDEIPPNPPKNARLIIKDGVKFIIWDESDSKDVIGYKIYKNGKVMNQIPLKTYYFEDKDYKEGDTYTITAIDKANNESEGITIK